MRNTSSSCSEARYAGIPADRIGGTQNVIDLPKLIRTEDVETVYLLNGDIVNSLTDEMREQIVERWQVEETARVERKVSALNTADATGREGDADDR